MAVVPTWKVAVVPRRVLIVDADSDSRTVYRIMLQHHGYEVHEVDDGERALEVLRRDPFHVVVTELTLRTMDGIELLTRLQAEPRPEPVCVVVLTARALPEDRPRALQAGCTSFLMKPVGPHVLLDEIRGLTERSD
ncbi:response regulator [soil metagenome]